MIRSRILFAVLAALIVLPLTGCFSRRSYCPPTSYAPPVVAAPAPACP